MAKITWDRPINETLRVVINDITYGLLYDSCSHMRHISPFVPGYVPPKRGALCGNATNLTATGSSEDICPECLAILNNLAEIKQP